MSNNISQTLFNQIQKMTIKEKLELMVYLANLIKNDEHKPLDFSPKKGYLSRFIGSGKGCYPTYQDADKFIRQERDTWDY